MKVLVTDASYKNTLAIVRCLGKRGIRVDASGRRKSSQSFYSRYCGARILYPDPRKNIKEFTDFMIKVVKRKNYDVLLPIGVYTTIPISYYKEAFEPYVRLPIAEYSSLIKAHDKSAALRIAKESGVPIPNTCFPKSEEEVEELSKKIAYPVVIKLRRGSSAMGLRYANSPEELVQKYFSKGQSDLVIDYELPMIQEYIPGEVHDVCVLFNEGKPRAALTQRRIKMYPVTGGGGIVNETTDEPELKKTAIRLLKKMRWHGPAQVEFKIDSRDAKPRLMEVNSKFWGTLDLSIQAGIDFPYLACKMAIDGDVCHVYDYKVGLTYRWLFPYELRYLIKCKNKLEATRDFLDFRGNFKYNISLLDPSPDIMSAFSILAIQQKKLTAKFERSLSRDLQSKVKDEEV